jgi:hypothetical protein
LQGVVGILSLVLGGCIVVAFTFHCPLVDVERSFGGSLKACMALFYRRL